LSADCNLGQNFS